MRKWIANIIITIPVRSLNEIYTCIPYVIITPFSKDSTVKILRTTLSCIDSSSFVYNSYSRTIIIHTYSYSDSTAKYVEYMEVTSCLDFQTTMQLLEKILKVTQ